MINFNVPLLKKGIYRRVLSESAGINNPIRNLDYEFAELLPQT